LETAFSFAGIFNTGQVPWLVPQFSGEPSISMFRGDLLSMAFSHPAPASDVAAPNGRLPALAE
jgi:hypothetical protein